MGTIIICVEAKTAGQIRNLLEQQFPDIEFVASRGTTEDCSVGRFVVKASHKQGKRIPFHVQDRISAFAYGIRAGLLGRLSM